MNENADTVAADPGSVRLPVTTSAPDCVALKQQLLMLVESSDAVLIDTTAVEVIDTAALQLLFAFSRERIASGLDTIWQGDNLAFRNAATALGLHMDVSAGPGAQRVPA